MKSITSELFYEYSFPHSISYDPEGKKAAFVLTRPDVENNSYKNRLWVCENGLTRDVLDLGTQTYYVWETERSVLFLQYAEKETRIMRGLIETGNIETVASFDLHIREFKVLSEGILAAICLEEIEDRDDGICTVLDELPYCKNGIGSFISKKRNSIYLLNLAANIAKQITARDFQVENYCIDGNTLFFNGSSYKYRLGLFQEVWRYNLGEEAPYCLYNGGEYNMRGLTVWDGELMMFGNTNPNIKLFHSEFYKIDRVTGSVSSFCKYDHSIRSYVTGDSAYGKSRLCKVSGEKLYFISTLENSSCLVSLDKRGKTSVVLQREGAICDFDIGNDRILFTALWDGKPLELYSAKINRLDMWKKTSSFHDAVLKNYHVSIPEQITFEFRKWKIYGWVLLPQNYDPKRKYPGLLNIHGGPNTVFSTAFSHEMQVWSALGFIVFFCNPVGSEGRGDEFMNIHGDFGGADYQCLQMFTDEVLKAYPAIDEKRLCVTGGSYGGFMTKWIITHTDRFAAAATQRSIANWITTTLLCDNGWYNMPPQMKADVFTGAEKLWEQSPLKYIDNVKTPTLILHSEYDYSVPVEEGLQMFSALAAKGVETRMVYFKDETHELSRSGRPLSRIRRIDEISKWMIDHTRLEGEKV